MEKDIERWRAGKEEVKDKKVVKGEGSHRGSNSYMGGSYKG